MILNDFIVPKSKFSNEQLDAVLAEVCGLVIKGQQDDPDFNGMVGAAVIDPKGRVVTGVNYLYGNARVHAERAAIDNYEQAYGELPKGCIVVTTLSPCSEKMDKRCGESCTDLLNEKHVKLAYCGYKDPTQDDRSKFTVIITANSKIEVLCKKFADTFLDEDYDPNGPPPGPEFKPTMPAGTVKVDVSDVYDWYKLGQNISNLDRANPEDFGKGPPSTIMAFGSEKAEHNYINNLKKLGLDTTDIDPVDPNQPKGMKRQKTDPTYNVDENFADGKVKGKSRPGRVKKAGASCNGSVTDLRRKAKNASGERAKMYHWCANMKSGKKKTNEVITNPNVKAKGANTANLVNKGEPIPAGKEQKLLGTKVGKLGAYEVYKWDKGNDSAYSIFNPQTRVSQLTVSGHNKAHAFEIFGVYAGPEAPVKAADLYAWLVRNQGLTLLSDKQQSPGGHRVWQDLEQRYGRSVNVYAFNMKTNKPINTGADDPESTHGTRGDTAQNVRLVAAPK